MDTYTEKSIKKLDKLGVRYRLVTDSTNEEISGTKTCEALGASPGQVFKSILFLSHGKRHRRSIMLIPADRKLAMGKAETAVGAPGRVAGKAEVLRYTGLEKGFFGPLCCEAFSVYIDTSVREWDSVFINAGGRGEYIELHPDDLLNTTGGHCVDLAGGKSVEQFAKNCTLPLSTVIRNYRITAVDVVSPLEIIYQGEDIVTGQEVDICEWFPDRWEFHSVRAYDGVNIRMLRREYDLARGFRPDPCEKEHILRFQNQILSHGNEMAALAFQSAPKILAIFPMNHTVYLVMEHVNGERLDERLLRTGPMDWSTVLTLLYPLLNQIEALGAKGDLLCNIRPDTVLLRENDALLLTYSAPTGIVGSHGSAFRFFYNPTYDPYIQVGGHPDAVSLFCSVIFYSLTGEPYSLNRDDSSEQIRCLLKTGMPEPEAKQLLGRIAKTGFQCTVT